MPLPLVPLIVLGLAGGAAWKVKKRRGMTPQREETFKKALNSSNVDAINNVAASFEGEGFHNEAQVLRKRAKLRGLSPEVKEARREVFRKAISCLDADKVELVARAFESEGCIGAASTLYLYARGLKERDPGELERIAKDLEKKKGEGGKRAAGILRGNHET